MFTRAFFPVCFLFVVMHSSIDVRAAEADSELQRLVFGSFRSEDNAQAWASELSRRLHARVLVQKREADGAFWFRVISLSLPIEDIAPLDRLAREQGLEFWRTKDVGVPGESVSPALADERPQKRIAPQVSPQVSQSVNPPAATNTTVESQVVYNDFDTDVAVQSRSFADSGAFGQSRWQPSLSVELNYYREWHQGGRLTFTPFLRLDAEDSERTHFDIRELFVTQIGDNWDLHVGFKQVFWGVTEFHHLVDIINQTDLVENVDGEDKLGQPMINFSLVRDWGILDVFVLAGFRERTFPGRDGRLRTAVYIDGDDTSYASASENHRIDGAIRWSHHFGPLEFGIYHFSGTSREPVFNVVPQAGGEFILTPHYTTIDQTGLDAQAIVGDWAFKLETISRSGYGDRYSAANVGVERTIVGVFGSRADLGLVAEYMYDDRSEMAFNTIYENDVAIGTRWRLNDVDDTQALIGVTWDLESDETIVSVEASRRFGDDWTLLLEGRVFGGGEQPTSADALNSLFDRDNKTGSLADDDYIQVELTRYF